MIEIGLTMLKLELLDSIARKKVASLVDFVEDVEVYLAYQVCLREALDLPQTNREMLYRGCAAVSDADLDRAEKEVKECIENADSRLTFFTQWSPLQKHLERSHSAEWGAMNQDFQVRMEAAVAEQDAASSDMLSRVGQVNAERQQAMNMFHDRHTRELLARNALKLA